MMNIQQVPAIKSVYVIMPVSSDPQADLKRQLLSNLATKLHLQLYLPHYGTLDPVSNLKITIALMQSANFIFADLSLERPSCYYELGLAEALEKCVYAVAQIGTDIHQTSVRQQVKYYKSLDDFHTVAEEIFVNGKMK